MFKNITAGRMLLYSGSTLLALLLLLSILAPMAAYPPYTTYSPNPDGAKALFLLLQQERSRVARLDTVVPDGRGLLIMVEPDGLEEPDWTQALGWVARGNTLLLADDNPGDLYQRLGLQLVQGGPGTVQAEPVASANPLLKDVRELSLTGGARLKKTPSATFAYGDAQGAYLAEVAEGKGRIVLLTTPDIFTNSEVDRADNLILFLNVIRLYGQPGIWFNEYAHGYTLAQTTREAFTWPLGLVVIQLALGILLLYCYWGKRFGRPVPLPEYPDLVAGEYVASLAGIYRQGRARGLILDSIYQGFKHHLAQYLGAPRNLPPGELVTLLSRRPLIDTRKLAELLDHCEGLLGKPGFSEADLFAMVSQLESWRVNNLEVREPSRGPLPASRTASM
jgi:hypothetical protein